MNDVEFLDSSGSAPAQEENLPVPGRRYYITVSKEGKQELVPYNPGEFEPLRAVELLMSGVYIGLALEAFGRGQPGLAAFMLAVSLLEFYCGMRRWPAEKK
jgi:hypothetical protein